MANSYPVSTIAKLFGLSERRIQQLAQEGIIPKPDKNQYELVGCVRAYINYLQQRAFGKGAAPKDTHLERARLIKAQADIAELDLAQRTGALITVDRVESDWMTMVNSCRSKLLSIPTKCAYQVMALDNPEEIQKYLERTIFEALSELADYEIDDDTQNISTDDETGDLDLDAATRDDGEPVGG